MNAALIHRRNACGYDGKRRANGVVLSDLIETLDVISIAGNPNVVIRDLVTDSRSARPGSLFFAIPGEKDDGSRYVADAIARGAIAIVTELESILPDNVSVIRVPNARIAKSRMAASFFGHPSQELATVGVTGTNGKTTTTKMIQAIAEYDRGPTVFLGTIGYEVAGQRFEAPNTTPDPIDIHRHLRGGLDRGARLAAMEVSSHALEQGRVADVRFQVAVFTNLTPEHLDYHETFEQYRDAKAKLFESLSCGAIAVLNADDPASDVFRARTQARVVTYGLERRADVTARIRRIDADGLFFTLVTPRGNVDIVTRLVGRYNLMNALAACAVALSLGYPLESIRGGFEFLKGVPGRLESVDCGQDFRVLVDYAHTDDALLKVLLNLRPLTHGRIITVFGCGGDRDRTKRPRMGKVASDFSDLVVVTSDNPRSEKPQAIVDEIITGIVPAARDKSRLKIELDRKKAIALALRAARGGDIVLIAGKGHEDYQIIGSEKLKFDDREVAKEVLWNR